MSVINSVLGLFLGNKYERDLKEINPYVDKIHVEFEKLRLYRMMNSGTRTNEIRKEIIDSIAEQEDEIKSLRDKSENEQDVYAKEELYNSIDKIEKQINEKLEDVLDSLVPRAFAVVKETARRFKENSTLEVTARQYDRDLAATRESITINGDKAILE